MDARTAALINVVLNTIGVLLLLTLLLWRYRQKASTEKMASIAYESGVAEGRTSVTLSLLGKLQDSPNVEVAVQEWMRSELTILDLEQKPSYMDLVAGKIKDRRPRVQATG